jgi:hypothetical protein
MPPRPPSHVAGLGTNVIARGGWEVRMSGHIICATFPRNVAVYTGNCAADDVVYFM